MPNFFGRTPEAAAVINPISLARVPGADPAIQKSFDFADQIAGQFGIDANAFRAALQGLSPTVTKQTDSDLSILNRLFSGGVGGDLANIRARRTDAMSGLTNTLFDDLRRTVGLANRGGASVSGSGLGSYLMGQAASEAGRLRAAEAYDSAEQERGDLMSILQAQLASTGQRQALTDSLANRMQAPAQFDMQGATSYQQLLTNAMNQALANLVSAYGMQA